MQTELQIYPVIRESLLGLLGCLLPTDVISQHSDAGLVSSPWRQFQTRLLRLFPVLNFFDKPRGSRSTYSYKTQRKDVFMKIL
jgi:hypothetical protein